MICQWETLAIKEFFVESKMWTDVSLLSGGTGEFFTPERCIPGFFLMTCNVSSKKGSNYKSRY